MRRLRSEAIAAFHRFRFWGCRLVGNRTWPVVAYLRRCARCGSVMWFEQPWNVSHRRCLR